MGSNVVSLAVGDFDGDGKDDLATGTSIGSPVTGVTVLRGDVGGH